MRNDFSVCVCVYVTVMFGDCLGFRNHGLSMCSHDLSICNHSVSVYVCIVQA